MPAVAGALLHDYYFTVVQLASQSGCVGSVFSSLAKEVPELSISAWAVSLCGWTGMTMSCESCGKVCCIQRVRTNMMSSCAAAVQLSCYPPTRHHCCCCCCFCLLLLSAWARAAVFGQQLVGLVEGLLDRLRFIPQPDAQERYLSGAVGAVLQQAHGRILRMLQQADVFKDITSYMWLDRVSCQCTAGACLVFFAGRWAASNEQQ